MPTVEEIEIAVAELDPEEFARFATWFAEHEASRRGAAEAAAAVAVQAAARADAVESAAAADPPAAMAQDNAAADPSPAAVQNNAAQDNAVQDEAADDDARPPPPAPVKSGPGPRYPTVTVKLKDLGTAAGPIIRRVSYALSDAGVEDDEIEKFKEQVRAGSNPVAVTRRWVTVR